LRLQTKITYWATVCPLSAALDANDGPGSSRLPNSASDSPTSAHPTKPDPGQLP
jgi:hypothetical protein